MFADDFFREIELDTLGAQIPIGDRSIGIEHENGVIGDILHQKAKLLFAAAHGLLRQIAVGEIAGDFGETNQPALVIAHRVDDDMGPEAFAIFAQTPVFAFKTAFFSGDGEIAFRDAVLAVLLAVENREMLADNFGFAIALEPRRTLIPAENLA